MEAAGGRGWSSSWARWRGGCGPPGSAQGEDEAGESENGENSVKEAARSEKTKLPLALQDGNELHQRKVSPEIKTNVQQHFYPHNI